jgi:hypothetical protein
MIMSLMRPQMYSSSLTKAPRSPVRKKSGYSAAMRLVSGWSALTSRAWKVLRLTSFIASDFLSQRPVAGAPSQ